jgi:ankyrin repeat protein
LSAGNWKELYQAATEGNLPLVKYHIREGANPNYQHPEILATPLVAAIVNGHTDVAIFLLKNGADAKLESYFDNLTPMKAAKKMKNKELITAIKALC